MGLNIEVKGDVAGIQAMAKQLQALAKSVCHSTTAIHRASSDSSHDWHGNSGDEFRSMTARFSTKTDGLGTQIDGMSKVVQKFGDDLAEVKDLMRRAREIALKGGLTCSAIMIGDPGAPPETASTMAPMDLTAYTLKVAAYREAAGRVRAARQLWDMAKTGFLAYLTSLREKLGLNLADLGTGIAGALLRSGMLFKATRAKVQILRDAESRLRAGGAPEFGTRTNKFYVERTLRRQVRLTNVFNAGLGLGKEIRLPGISLAITSASAIWDMAQGKNPTVALVSGFGGLAIAAVVFAGAPPTLLVAGGAFLVSSVSSVAIESFMNWTGKF